MSGRQRGRIFRRDAFKQSATKIRSLFGVLQGGAPHASEPRRLPTLQPVKSGQPLTDGEWQEILRCAGGVEANDRPGFVLSMAETRRSVLLLVVCWALVVPSFCPRAIPKPVPQMASCPNPDAAHCADLQGIDALWWGRRLDLNLATAVELQVVPGIGQRLAARILADREGRGPFCAMSAVQRVRGVGPQLRKKMEAFVEVRITRCSTAPTAPIAPIAP